MKCDENKPNKLIVVTEHFAPSSGATAQLVADLVQDLVATEHDVRVLTSTPAQSPLFTGVVRFPFPLTLRQSILFKSLKGSYFFARTLIWLVFHATSFSRILIVSNPPFIGLLGPLINFFCGKTFFFLFQDLFPRSAFLSGVLPAAGPLANLTNYFTKVVLTRSSTTIVLSEAMKARCLKDYGPLTNIEVIHNWSVIPTTRIPKHQSSLSTIYASDKYFTVQYSGNFGRLHDLLTLLEAARLLKHEPIQFVFIGDGSKRVQILAYSRKYNLNNITIYDYQPRALLSDSLSATDLSVVSLIPGAEDTVAPSKFYGILASSRPVILISNSSSEIASLVNKHKAGFVCCPGDVLELAERIAFLSRDPELLADMQENARALYQDHYGRNKSFNLYQKLLFQ